MSRKRKRSTDIPRRNWLSLFTGVSLVSLGIVLCFCLPALAAPVQNISLFDDLQAHWARSQVMRLAGLDVVSGYPDHTYKPDQPVNRLETVVLILRSGGFTKEADQLASSYKRKNIKSKKGATNNVASVRTPKVAWGQSYLDLAVQKGFLPMDNPDNYDAEGPASRLEVAELLARALYLVPPSLDSGSVPAEKNAPAVAGSAAVKTFSDLDTLTPAEQACIQAVANAGVLSGNPDGTFRPQESLTRAEMAVILSRLVDRGWVKVPAGRRLTGWIAGVENKKNQQEIDFTSLSGLQKLKVSKSVQCYLSGEEKPLTQAANYRCEVILDGRKQVSWINLLEQKNDAVNTVTIRGSVKQVALGEDNVMVLCDMTFKDLILPLAWDAVVTGKKTTQGFNSLKEGDFVDVKVTQGQVIEVTPLTVKTVSGQVDRISGSRLFFKEGPSGDKPGWFNYYTWARITDKDGVQRGIVMVGEQVQVTYLDPLPGEIDDEIPLEIKVMN